MDLYISQPYDPFEEASIIYDQSSCIQLLTIRIKFSNYFAQRDISGTQDLA